MLCIFNGINMFSFDGVFKSFVYFNDGNMDESCIVGSYLFFGNINIERRRNFGEFVFGIRRETFSNRNFEINELYSS